MDLKLKIKCFCFCSYTIDESIATDEISCPNCGKSPNSSADIIKLLKLAKEIPSKEPCEDGKEISIRPFSFGEEMNDF